MVKIKNEGESKEIFSEKDPMKVLQKAHKGIVKDEKDKLEQEHKKQNKENLEAIKKQREEEGEENLGERLKQIKRDEKHGDDLTEASLGSGVFKREEGPLKMADDPDLEKARENLADAYAGTGEKKPEEVKEVEPEILLEDDKDYKEVEGKIEEKEKEEAAKIIKTPDQQPDHIKKNLVAIQKEKAKNHVNKKSKVEEKVAPKPEEKPVESTKSKKESHYRFKQGPLNEDDKEMLYGLSVKYKENFADYIDKSGIMTDKGKLAKMKFDLEIIKGKGPIYDECKKEVAELEEKIKQDFKKKLKKDNKKPEKKVDSWVRDLSKSEDDQELIEGFYDQVLGLAEKEYKDKTKEEKEEIAKKQTERVYLENRK